MITVGRQLVDRDRAAGDYNVNQQKTERRSPASQSNLPIRMKAAGKERTFPILAVTALAAALLVLGVLQYRWSGEISQAASERMHANMQRAMLGFGDALAREFSDLCLALQPPDELRSSAAVKDYAEHFLRWKQSATHGPMVDAIYLAEQQAPQKPVQLLHLDPAAQQFVAAQWPANLSGLEHAIGNVPPGAAPMGLHLDRPNGPPPHGGGNAWLFDQQTPALVFPLVGDGPPQSTPPAMRYLIVGLDRRFLQEHVFPELSHTWFASAGGLDFKVAIVEESPQHREVVYSSDPGFPASREPAYASHIELFGPPGPPPRPQENAVPTPGGQSWELSEHRLHRAAHIMPLTPGPADRGWELFVDPRNGSVEAMVASLRRRNLAVSFGILIVLAGTIAAIVGTAVRSRRLAQLQMDFVTGVTHELRTPLAVILSAAENIKDGVVSRPAALAQYGAIIDRQARQLMQLVEQVLLFASSRDGRRHYEIQPVEVAWAIDTALENAGMEGITLERKIEPDLPEVLADPVALTQCVQNLVINAIKYGGENKWVGVNARKEDSVNEISISVEDHGIGIQPSEIARIFQPFYRSHAVSASNVHGTGLGLPITKSMIKAMKGRITVVSRPGHGSCFTVHLPMAMKAN